MRKAYVAAGWAWAAAIVWLSLAPLPPVPQDSQGDKFGHLAAYGLLMFWFAFLYPRARTRAIFAGAFVAMGAGLEFIQGGLGYRTYEVFDMLANAIGVLLGWAAAVLFKKFLLR